MAAGPRIFVSFAIEDESTKNLFIGQKHNDQTPFNFTDMSVKKPWSEAWKTNCRTKISGCDGVIVLVTMHLNSAEGALWEIRCAKEEGVPLVGILVNNERPTVLPDEMVGVRLLDRKWSDVAIFVDSLQ